MSELISILGNIPFTALATIVLVASGVYARTHVGPINESVHQRLGHSPHLFWDGGFHRVMSSLCVTSGGWHFYCSLVMFTFAVGWVEVIQGTRVALTAFFGIHLATILLMLAGIALFTRLINSHRGNLLWYARDVGPSAGYYGCLGLAITKFLPSMMLPIALTVSSLLAMRLLWSSYLAEEEGRTMSADIAHLIAFPLGVICSNLLVK